MKKTYWLFLSFLLFAGVSFSDDARIQRVFFHPNKVVSVYGTTFITTQIIFGEREKILDIQGGDADAWTLNVSRSIPNVLNLKPTMSDSNTDIIVSTKDDTNKIRRYFFHLISEKANSASGQHRQTYALQFQYPKKLHLSAPSSISTPRGPQQYNWNYSFNGSTQIMPEHIFDDGEFTYMQLRPHQTVPAVFSVDNTAGRESVVNYRRVGNYLIIESISPQFTLRDGRYHVASVFNNKRIRQLQRTRGV